jgi:serine/threonine protein kinase
MPSIKLINQGTYGCVYHPGIKCNGNAMNSEKFITKIQKNDSTVKNEIHIGKTIKTIPNFSRYFAPIIDSCPAKITKTDGCKITQKSNDTTFISNKIRYVGKQTLGEYITERDKGRERERFIRTQKRLIRAIRKLTEYGVVHFDVKQNNVMYDDRLKEPVMIDFGLSFRIDDVLGVNSRENLQEKFYTFNTYDYWPVEVCMFGYAFSELGVYEAGRRRITADEIDRVLYVFVNGRENSKGDRTPNGLMEMEVIRVDEFLHDAREYFGRYVGKTWIAMYDHMMEAGVWKRWDKYGLDVTYLFIAESNPELKKLAPKVQLLPSA